MRKVMIGVVSLLILLILGTWYFEVYRPAQRDQRELEEIESVIGAKFPRDYTRLVMDYSWERSTSGRMTVKGEDIQRFLREMKMTEKIDFPVLLRFGDQKCREIFAHPERLRGWLGVYGTIQNRNGWEFAYNPVSKELWFVMFWHTRPWIS